MPARLPVIGHRHRITFTYPLKDALEVRFEGGGAGDGYLHSGQVSLNCFNGNGTQADSSSYLVNYLEPHTPTAGLTYEGTPTPPGYSGGGGTPSVNGIAVPVLAGMYSGDVQSLRVYLVGPSAQEIDLLNETGIGSLFSNGSINYPLPGAWQDILLPGTTYLWIPLSTLSVEIPETGTWNIWVETETIFSDSPNNDWAPYLEALNFAEVVAGEIPYQSVRYVDREVDDTDDDMNVYTATPTCVIKFPVRTGAFDEQPIEINLPKDSFTAAISKGEPFAPISVLVERVYQDGTIFPVFKGFALTATRNPGGRSDRVMVKAVNLKSLLRVPLGVPALAECAWTFTGRACGVDVFELDMVIQGVVQSVSGKVATVLGDYSGDPPWTGAENDRLYQRGFLILNGVRLPIREWDVAAYDTFYMTRQVPSSWVGETVLMIPGCDKTLTTCRSRWDNESRFGGAGFAIPTRNPLVEQ